MSGRRAGASWICCQLGAREHYVVPRALHRAGRLRELVTDAWVAPSSPLQLLPGEQARRLRERYHPDLADAAVCDFTSSLITHEVLWKTQRLSGWPSFMVRNAWFQEQALHHLKSVDTSSSGTVLFAHSYAALAPFRWAKARGWTLVLSQIDPGEHHFDVVALAAQASPQYGPAPLPPPPEYFSQWREECALADRIVVNSSWTAGSLEQAGVPRDKMSIVPLAYEPQQERESATIDRQYPDAFTPSRPLRILYVGQVAVAKGAAALLEAFDALRDRPVHLTMVGATSMQVPHAFLSDPSITWAGHIPRQEVMRHYRDADVLVFPSMSDGFGMAQIEACGWGLPIVASRHCGEVVEHGVNGLLLPEVSAGAIANAIRTLLDAPASLTRFAGEQRRHVTGGLDAMGQALLEIIPNE